MAIIIPEGARKVLIAVILLAALVTHVYFSVIIGKDVLDANGVAPIYDDVKNYFVGLVAALVGTPIAIALGQRPPDLPPNPNGTTPTPTTPPAPSAPVGATDLLKTFPVRASRLGARATFQTGSVDNAIAKVIGVLFILVWVACGAFVFVVWFANRSESSIAVYSHATAFSGIVIGALTYAVRGKS